MYLFSYFKHCDLTNFGNWEKHIFLTLKCFKVDIFALLFVIFIDSIIFFFKCLLYQIKGGRGNPGGQVLLFYVPLTFLLSCFAAVLGTGHPQETAVQVGLGCILNLHFKFCSFKPWVMISALLSCGEGQMPKPMLIISKWVVTITRWVETVASAG